MRKTANILIVLLFAALILSCSHNSGTSGAGENAAEPYQTLPPVKSPGSSFAIGVEKSDEGTFLSIQKNALEKEFLIQSSLAEQRQYGGRPSNPTSSALKSRVVKFTEDGDQLLLTESNEGKQPGNEMPAHILLTTFPIKTSDDKKIVFDFNKGMANLIIAWDWYASDFGGKVIEPDISLPIESSYIRETKEYDGALSVTHTLAVKDFIFTAPIEITYYFTLYKKNPAFVPVKSPGFDHLAYFETTPVSEKDFGSLYTNITRFDISKPVTFYISTAVPEKYREAAREGVLYWNKAFGKEVMKAEIAPEGMTAPDFEHNIIQWHTDSSGSAYADAHSDPLTGEILHAQVYFRSGWGDIFRYSVIPKIQRQLENSPESNTQDALQPDAPAKKDLQVTAKQIEEGRLCTLDVAEVMKDLYLMRGEVETLSPEKLDALTSDVIRLVVAHEVGHTLGLRHNFAGSLVNETSSAEEETILKNYIEDGKLPDNLGPLSNSVMDYALTQEDILIGAIIEKPDSDALSHDAYAIKWGYFGYEDPPRPANEPFCTDSATMYFDDCQRWDAGGHLAERRAFYSIKAFENLPRLVAEAYRSAKASYDPLMRRPVKEATPSAMYILSNTVIPWMDLMSLFGSKLKLVSIYSQFPDLSEIDLDDIAEKTTDWLNSELAFAGGVEKTMQLIKPEFYMNTIANFNSKFEEIVESGSFRTVELPEGGSANFSDSEIDYMKERAAELFVAVDEKLARAITSNLAGNIKPIDDIEKVESMTAKWAEFVITSGSNAQNFRYGIAVRKEAATLLTQANGPFPDWLDSFVPAIAEKLKVKLEAVFGKPIEEINVSQFPRDKQQWAAEELSIYKMLAPQ